MPNVRVSRIVICASVYNMYIIPHIYNNNNELQEEKNLLIILLVYLDWKNQNSLYAGISWDCEPKYKAL